MVVLANNAFTNSKARSTLPAWEVIIQTRRNLCRIGGYLYRWKAAIILHPAAVAILGVIEDGCGKAREAPQPLLFLISERTWLSAS